MLTLNIYIKCDHLKSMEKRIENQFEIRNV